MEGNVRNMEFEHGERGGTRTHDHMIKSHVLYQLSYALAIDANRAREVRRTIRTGPGRVNG